ncbi:MAG: hypothetical protein K8I29_08050 [Alphaproteobacteria bacterium]|uniref:Uncharacterized protein n=1 Tax=Candidatus Nitrobium versatile TaxID=2884831 RepID=A0A953M1S8_9BACT|nr:hypothetical protein [Candidatus Nitrobium versatile]
MAGRQKHDGERESGRQHKLAAGLVSEKFPGVERMVLHMTYYQKGENPVLMVRTVNVLPSSPAYFKMECMIRGCLNGGFDLTPVIRKMLKEQKRTMRGRMECEGTSRELPPDHAHISYEITVEYRKKR